MTALTNIIRKELKELLTPSTVAPIVAMALVFGLIGNMMGGIQEQVQAKPMIGIVSEDNGVLANLSLQILMDNAKVYYNGTNVSDGLRIVQAKGGTAVLLIPSNFTSRILDEGKPGVIEAYWIMRGAGLLDAVSSSTVDALLANVGRGISAYLVGTGAGINPSLALSPMSRMDTTYFHSMVMTGVSPGTLSNLLSGQSLIIPIVIMLIVIMAGSMVISSMGMEKENKTLETLLTLPVRRSSIVAGKLIASALVGLLMAGIYMIGFGYYMGGLSGNSSVNLAAYGIVITPLDYVLLGLSVFGSLFAALALCMVLGSFAKNYKAAQTLTMPVTLLAMLPMFMTMFWDFNTMPPAAQVLVFAIPFSHPMMAMRSLMFQDYAFVLAGIAYSLTFAIVMILVAVWIFRTDRLMTGRIGRRSGGRRTGIVALLARRRSGSP